MSEKASKFLFQPGDGSASILHSWWEGLEYNRGERAAMRRASSPTNGPMTITLQRPRKNRNIKEEDTNEHIHTTSLTDQLSTCQP